MPKRKTINKFLIAFLILFFALSPFNFNSLPHIISSFSRADASCGYGQYICDNYTVIEENQTWEGNVVFDNPFKPVVIAGGATITVKPGARIEMMGLEVWEGQIIAAGTEKEKITFTSSVPNCPEDQQEYCENNDIGNIRGSFYFMDYTGEDNDGNPDDDVSFFRYVEFSNLGYSMAGVPEALNTKTKSRGLFNTAYADELTIIPALSYYSGRVKIENATFKNNGPINISVNARSYQDEPNVLRVSNSNFEGGPDDTAVHSSFVIENREDNYEYRADGRVILTNNWYGSELGPRQAPDYLIGGEKITGDYALNGFRSNDLIADPVLVVPGIMGSANVGNFQKLDPIFHTYDNLVASLKENGYEADKNFFEFPYQWRDSNIITAEKLKDEIEDIKNDTNISRVDLITHSMGGLVARYYIESENYRNDVDQLVILGTPHRGAPKSYLIWEAGEDGFLDKEEKVIGQLLKIEAHILGYNNLQNYIQSRVLSVQELLPDYDYLKEAGSGKTRNYPDNYPRNTFLEYLNDDDRIENLDPVNFINIIGDAGDDSTIEKFRVVDSTVPGSWEHGMPEHFDDPSTDRGIENGEGDETVPLFSAEDISADEKITLNSSHGDLPTKAQCEIFERLTGKDECDYVSTFERITHILTFGVFSPIDIQVIDKNGKWTGKNIANFDATDQIKGAYYTGSDADAEFLTIPNPIDGEYKILTQGTGDGDYKIEVSSISENEDNPVEASESAAEITGTAQTGQIEELKIEVQGDEVTAGEKDETPPTINIISPEEKEYFNNQILPINYFISDNISPADKVVSEVYYDGNKFTENSLDLSLEHLGNHQIKITAQDEALNESEKTASFSVATSISAMMDNVNHYDDLKLIKNKKDKEFLENQLKILKNNLTLLEKIKENDKTKPRIKKELTELFEKLANRHIDLLIKFIETNRRNAFTEQARELLREALNFIRPK